MLLGHARGKVGDLVFSRSNGQQVVRARARVVKNPKTEQQIVQRIILNTVAQAYSKMQPIVNHSFEGVSEGQRSMSRFMRANLDKLRTKIAQEIAAGGSYYDVSAFTPLGTNIFQPNDFVVSAGSLPNVTVQRKEGSSSQAVAILGGTTYGDILNALGLKRGDQLTFMMLKARGQLGAEISFDFTRIILDPTNVDGSPADLSTPLITDGAVTLPSPRNTGQFTVLTMAAGGDLTFDTGATGNTAFSAAVIVSRQSASGEWLRSNTNLVTFDQNVVGFTYSLGEAIDFSAENSLGALSDLYLNNAGTSPIASQGGALNIELSAYQGTTAAGTVTIVALGYETITGQGDVLMAYDANNEKYAVAIGNDESVNYAKWILRGAASLSEVTTSLPISNGANSPKNVHTNNEFAMLLQARGYISPMFLALSDIIQS